MINHLALVTETDQLSSGELTRVAAALSKQIMRDFAPIWQMPSTLDAFEKLEDVPTGYWPIIVMEDINVPGAAGIHLDDDGKPFGMVNLSDSWSLTASHEALEMLGDPLGNTLRAGPSVHPDQDRVEYLVEICDPSEAWEFGYDVNGVRVSDFYTPDFFLPFESGNVRYSFTGAIEKPRQVLDGGYLSWLDPATGDWWQQTWFDGAAPQFRKLGKLEAGGKSPREQLDQWTAPERLTRHPLAAPKTNTERDRLALVGRAAKTASSKAVRLRSQISGLLRDARA